MSGFPHSLAFESISPNEIAKAATIFDNLKQLRIKLKNGDENVLERAFEIHVQNLLEKLEHRLQNTPDQQSSKIEIILARHGLYDAAFQQVVLLCQSISPVLGDGVKELRNIHSNFLSDFQQICIQYNDENIQLGNELHGQHDVIQQLQDNMAKLEDTVKALNDEAENQNKLILDLRNQLRSAHQEINYLRETPMSSSQTGGKGANKELVPFDTSLHNLYGDAPNTPNKSTGGPAGLKRSNSANSLSGMNSVNTSKGGRKSLGPNRISSWSMAGGPDENNYHGNTAVSVADNISIGKSPARGTLALVSPVVWLHSFREDTQRAIDEGRCRHITLNECKEVIASIYESKAAANEKSLQGVGNLPMETLEQHTFRLLEKKYGLRSLAVNHAGNLLKALELYANEDNEVMVFQKIFYNEIEEDFRFVQMELVKSIKELTMVQIMGRNPLKDSTTLQQMLDSKLSTGSIYEDEWKDMINYLYNASDATTLGVLLKRQAMLEQDNGPLISATTTLPGSSVNGSSPSSSSTLGGTGAPHLLPGNTLLGHKITKPPSTGGAGYVIGTPNLTHHRDDLYQTGQLGYNASNSRDVKRLGYASPTLKINIKDPSQLKAAQAEKNKPKSNLKLLFSTFIKIVLDFQLRSHMEYLANFLHLYRQYDKDVDGVLNGGEFKEFFHFLYQTSQQQAQQANPDFYPDNGGGGYNEEEELKTLFALVKLIDPHEHDRFVFSNCVICLQKLQ